MDKLKHDHPIPCHLHCADHGCLIEYCVEDHMRMVKEGKIYNKLPPI